ncbi:hypothetical protein D3C79_1030090 [compost metagenome]
MIIAVTQLYQLKATAGQQPGDAVTRRIGPAEPGAVQAIGQCRFKRQRNARGQRETGQHPPQWARGNLVGADGYSIQGLRDGWQPLAGPCQQNGPEQGATHRNS